MSAYPDWLAVPTGDVHECFGCIHRLGQMQSTVCMCVCVCVCVCVWLGRSVPYTCVCVCVWVGGWVLWTDTATPRHAVPHKGASPQ